MAWSSGVLRTLTFSLLLLFSIENVGAVPTAPPTHRKAVKVSKAAQKKARRAKALAKVSKPRPLSEPEIAGIKKLRALGYNEKLLSELQHHPYREETAKKTIELVVTGFMKRGEYSAHYSETAIRKAAEFAIQNSAMLDQTEKDFGVDKEVIVALLWVETKFGTYTGKDRVLDSFFAIFQADHPSRIAEVREAMRLKFPEATPEELKKAEARGTEKSKWALEELLALQRLHQQEKVDATSLKGSFAGAFGLPQFLPSSVFQYAKSPDPAYSLADLFRKDVAIYSVGSYLSINGYQSGDSAKAEKSRVDALFHYNRAIGYGQVILKIAAELQKLDPNRGIANSPNRNTDRLPPSR